jgi:phosphate transport system substrate-binding protein
VASAFAAAQPLAIPIAVLPAIGSRGALRGVREGRLNVALTNLAPEGSAADGLRIVEYAQTPFVMAVRNDLPVQQLSSAELARLYGDDGRFPDGTRARPVMRPGDDVDNQLIASHSPAVASALRAALERPGMLSAATDSDTADLIEATPGAFGGSTLAQMLSERRRMRALEVDGQPPTVEGLRNGRYRLFKRLYAITRAAPGAEVEAFIRFLLSAPGRAVLGAHGHLIS